MTWLGGRSKAEASVLCDVFSGEESFWEIIENALQNGEENLAYQLSVLQENIETRLKEGAEKYVLFGDTKNTH